MEDLEALREKIDDIDRKWVELLAERSRLTHEVGLHKRRHGLSPVDKSREATQFERIGTLAMELGLDPDLPQEILSLIIDRAIMSHVALQEAAQGPSQDTAFGIANREIP